MNAVIMITQDEIESSHSYSRSGSRLFRSYSHDLYQSRCGDLGGDHTFSTSGSMLGERTYCSSSDLWLGTSRSESRSTYERSNWPRS